MGSSFLQTSNVKKPDKATVPHKKPIQSFQDLPASALRNQEPQYIETCIIVKIKPKQTDSNNGH